MGQRETVLRAPRLPGPVSPFSTPLSSEQSCEGACPARRLGSVTTSRPPLLREWGSHTIRNSQGHMWRLGRGSGKAFPKGCGCRKHLERGWQEMSRPGFLGTKGTGPGWRAARRRLHLPWGSLFTFCLLTWPFPDCWPSFPTHCPCQHPPCSLLPPRRDTAVCHGSAPAQEWGEPRGRPESREASQPFSCRASPFQGDPHLSLASLT